MLKIYFEMASKKLTGLLMVEKSSFFYYPAILFYLEINTTRQILKETKLKFVAWDITLLILVFIVCTMQF